MFKPSRNALVLLVAAVMLMLSAGAGATAALVITGKQIKDGTVTSKDIKNKSLKVKDLSTKAQAKLKGRTGATGATGPRGAVGPAGPAGPAGLLGLPGLDGLSGFEIVTAPSLPLAGVTSGTTSAACPPGKKAIAASGGPATPVLGILTQVTRLSESAFEASALSALPIVGGTLNLQVVCAAIPS